MLAEISEYWTVVPPIAESLADVRRWLGWKPAVEGAGAGAMMEPTPPETDDSALIAELTGLGFSLPTGV